MVIAGGEPNMSTLSVLLPSSNFVIVGVAREPGGEALQENEIEVSCDLIENN